jgi:hypothetical protein
MGGLINIKRAILSVNVNHWNVFFSWKLHHSQTSYTKPKFSVMKCLDKRSSTKLLKRHTVNQILLWRFGSIWLLCLSGDSWTKKQIVNLFLRASFGAEKV